jgi:hypothetical protein
VAKPWRNATEWSGAQALSLKPPAASERILINERDKIGRRTSVGFSTADAPPARDVVALQIRADLELDQSPQRTAVPDPEAALSGRAQDRPSRVEKSHPRWWKDPMGVRIATGALPE